MLEESGCILLYLAAAPSVRMSVSPTPAPPTPRHLRATELDALSIERLPHPGRQLEGREAAVDTAIEGHLNEDPHHRYGEETCYP